NPPLVAGGDVDIRSAGGRFWITPDGARVVYRADALVDGRHELWSSPIAGGATVRLSQDLPEGADGVPAFTLSRDGAFVLYQADAGAPGVFELYRAATDRSKTARRANGRLTAGGSLGPSRTEARFAFAGERVLYLAREDDPRTLELFE